MALGCDWRAVGAFCVTGVALMLRGAAVALVWLAGALVGGGGDESEKTPLQECEGEA